MRAVWVGERRETLRRLWVEERLTGSEIARRMGTTRQAATAAAIRLFGQRGYTPTEQRADGLRSGHMGARASRAAAPKPAKPAKPALYINQGSVRERAPDMPAPRWTEASGGMPFLTAKPSQCQWPVGGEGADTRVCGREAELPKRYCGLHQDVRTKGWTAELRKLAAELGIAA